MKFLRKVNDSIEKSQLVALLNSVNEAIISIDTSGKIQIYNSAALNLLDTNINLKNKHIDSVCKITLDGKPISLFNEISAQKHTIARDDLELKYTDDESISLSLNSSPVWVARSSDNVLSGYILAIRDITKAKSLDEERDEFISVVSHELRTPLTIAEGTLSNAELLFERGASPSKLLEMLKSSHEQVLYLSKMVNDLSTLSRAERGIADSPEKVDITQLAQELYNEYSPKAHAKNLTLDLDITQRPGSILVSKLYLEEILQNFLTNSIKYTLKGGVILRVEKVVRETGENIRFSVKDTGIGISKSDQNHIFERFFRSEDYRTRESSGTGLGLYVVKKLSHKLGTTIEVKSRLNHGSEFSFELPVIFN
jgi:signal transduction histidine kinase